MDVKRLTLAPWLVDNWDEVTFKWLLSPNGRSDREFIAMARNAFDVMMRRGWQPYRVVNGNWRVEDSLQGLNNPIRVACHMEWPDPFTALVAADEWMKKKEQQT